MVTSKGQRLSLDDDDDDDWFSPTTNKRFKRKDTSFPSLWSAVLGVEKSEEIDRVVNSVREALPARKKTAGSAKEIAHFFLYCYERQKIWERIRRGAKEPFTQSAVLRNYSFCNNYRELDRGTGYFRAFLLRRREKLLRKHGKNGIKRSLWLKQTLWFSLCYRLINRIETFEAYGRIPSKNDWPDFRSFLEDRMGEGTVVFTDAHQSMGIRRFVETMELLREKELHPLTRAIYFCNSSNNNSGNSHIERVYESIREGLPNVGQFLAWQVTCDLAESNCCCSGPGDQQPNDKEEDFCKLGNGAKKGLELIFGKIPSCVELEKAGFLCSQQETVYNALGLRFPKFRGMPLGLKNIEHALCEYSKYSSIQANCLRGRSSSQRKRKSRAFLDDRDTVCRSHRRGCGQNKKNDGDVVLLLLCTTCRTAYCWDCALGADTKDEDNVLLPQGCSKKEKKKKKKRHWVCSRCVALERMEFVSSRTTTTTTSSAHSKVLLIAPRPLETTTLLLEKPQDKDRQARKAAKSAKQSCEGPEQTQKQRILPTESKNQ